MAYDTASGYPDQSLQGGGAMNAMVSPHLSTRSFSVPDIHCAGCVRTLEQVLGRSDDIESYDVSLADRQVDIVSAADVSDIVRLFRDAGFRAMYRSDDDQTDAAMLTRLGVAGIGMMQIMMFASAEYLAGGGGIDPALEALMRWASLALASVIVVFAAQPFYQGAYRDLRRRQVGMDVPIALAILGAYGISLLATLTNGHAVYFDSVCMFTFLLLLGRYLERMASKRVRSAGGLADRLLPSHVTLADGQERAINAVSVGDLVKVPGNTRIPVDGYVLEGMSSVHEAVFTGESWPVIKQEAHPVYAGTFNIEDTLTVRTSKPATEFLINQLSRMIRSASQHKPAFAILADRIARFFVGGVLTIAVLSGAYWFLAGNSDWFVIVLTVLVVSCPCALSLATPIAYTWAITTLQRQGLAVSQGKFLEDLNRVTDVVIDKTGTLTTAKPTIASIQLLDRGTGKDPLAIAAALETDIKHPFANAFRRYLPDGDMTVDQLSYINGRGIRARVNGHPYVLGSPEYVSEETGTEMLERPDADGSWILLASEKPLAWFQLLDDLRDDAVSLIHRLSCHRTITMLSGDSPREASRVAQTLGVQSFRSQQTPEEKLAYIRDLQSTGGVVLVIGDGVNDAGAMAVADCAIAINPADIVVQASADATATGGDFKSVIFAIDYVSRVRRIIRQNIGWAVGYNLCMMPLAILGLIEPWTAALGMSLSSLIVVLNSGRLAMHAFPDAAIGPK
ncbi:MAG: cation-translocating P-type ATPase [Pseudomonadota bacterium]